MWIAITRPVSPSLADCQLTHLPRQPIDLPRAIAQHAAYEDALRTLGLAVHHAPAAPGLPDAVFIEDTALALDEVAIILRPGAPSRRPETAAVARVLAQFRTLLHLQPPATLDGGDILRIGRTLYVGQSARTNSEGITQLQTLTAPFGYHVQPIPVTDCLHLKSAVTQIADNLLLINPAWLPPNAFPTMDRIQVDPTEPYAANALFLPRTLLYPTHFPRTLDRLLKRNLPVTTVDNTELAKAEGAVTCCSILLQAT